MNKKQDCTFWLSVAAMIISVIAVCVTLIRCEPFTVAGVTRSVEVRNAKTGEMELRPINEMASSHLARRTFVGNAYKQVSDPNIIGKMSGHVEGSKAFSRYRNIEDETLRNVINQIG